MIKFKIILEAVNDHGSVKKGETLIIYNEIFNPINGVAYFPIGENFKIISYHQYIQTVKGIDIYENDKVLVRGTKRVGEYETVVIRNSDNSFTLKENKTYIIDNKCLMAIKEIIE